MRKDPEERLTTDDVLAHPWVTQHHTSAPSSSGSNSSGVTPSASSTTSSQHLHISSAYSGSRHVGGSTGSSGERSMVSSRGRALHSNSSNNGSTSTTTPSQTFNTSPPVGISTSLGLPARAMPGSTSSALSAVAAAAAPNVGSGFVIPPLLDAHNGMDQMVPESFHGGLGGVSDKY